VGVGVRSSHEVPLAGQSYPKWHNCSIGGDFVQAPHTGPRKGGLPAQREPCCSCWRTISQSIRWIAALPLPGSAEEQDVAIRVANLEAAQTVVGILKRYAECCAMIGKFDGECIGVWCKDVGIPPHGGITLGVRQGRRAFVGLDEELCAVTADDGEKRAPIRLLESRLKAKLVTVKCDGLIDVADDEEW